LLLLWLQALQGEEERPEGQAMMSQHGKRNIAHVTAKMFHVYMLYNHVVQREQLDCMFVHPALLACAEHVHCAADCMHHSQSFGAAGGEGVTGLCIAY
jgi:hypothetical protein